NSFSAALLLFGCGLSCIPGVAHAPIGIANESRADRNGPCCGLLADRNHLHIKRNRIALGATERSHLLQVFRTVCVAHDLFEKSTLHQRIVWKFNHAVMVWRCCVLEKTAVSVFCDLLGFQNFGSYLQGDDLVFPIELVLLDIIEAIRLVIDWRSKRWRL